MDGLTCRDGSIGGCDPGHDPVLKVVFKCGNGGSASLLLGHEGGFRVDNARTSTMARK
jgi:hypothetical protein